MQNTFKIYDSVSEFCGADIAPIDDVFNRVGHGWAGYRDFAQSREYFLAGASEAETKPARDLLNAIDVEVHGHKGDVWAPSVQGAFPCVHDWLIGSPTAMRSKVQEETECAPVRVVLNISVAAGVNQHTIAHRAAAAAAFAMKLSEHRPVELWAAVAVRNDDNMTDCGFRVKLDMPINLSQVMAAFNPSVCRRLAIAYCHTFSGGTSNQFSYSFNCGGASPYEDRDKFVRNMRAALKLGEDDIVLDAGILSDVQQIDRNPVQWVKDMLAKYGEQTDD